MTRSIIDGAILAGAAGGGGGGGVTSVDGKTGVVVLTPDYVNVTGDTMTGPLTVNGAATFTGGPPITVTPPSGYPRGPAIMGSGDIQVQSPTNSIVVGTGAPTAPSLSSAVVVGHGAFSSALAADRVVAIGAGAGATATADAAQATSVGYNAKATTSGTALGATAAAEGTFGTAVGFGATASGSQALALGHGAQATNTGSVAIGVDDTGAAAAASTANDFVLGTGKHLVKVSGNLWMNSVGRVAIATNLAPNPNEYLRVGTTNSNYPVSGAPVYGVFSQPRNDGAGNVIGYYSNPVTAIAGAMGTVTGVEVGIRFASATTAATSGYGLWVHAPNITAGATITTMYGAYIETQKGTGVTTAYGIFQQGPNDLNLFLGPIVTGSSTAASSTGTIRMAHQNIIASRNSTNNGDVNLLTHSNGWTYIDTVTGIGVQVGATSVINIRASTMDMVGITAIKALHANGCKFGSAATEKISFYGATSIVQPTGTPAAATDAATTQTLANYLRTQLLALGLIA